MKIILCSCLVLAAAVHAEEAADRGAIARTIAALNQDPQPAGLFVEGADASLLGGLGKGKPRMTRIGPEAMAVIISHEPWGEARIGPVPVLESISPRISSGSVQFITPEVAVADGAFTYTEMNGAVQSTPLLFVMKRDGLGWSIALIRLAGTPPASN